MSWLSHLLTINPNGSQQEAATPISPFFPIFSLPVMIMLFSIFLFMLLPRHVIIVLYSLSSSKPYPSFSILNFLGSLSG